MLSLQPVASSPVPAPAPRRRGRVLPMPSLPSLVLLVASMAEYAATYGGEDWPEEDEPTEAGRGCPPA